MNTKIRALMEQASCSACYDEPNQISLMNNEIELFAELIVRECAAQIVAKGTDWVDFAPSQTGVRPEYWDMAQQIKEHFGVEE